jgi:hypothetical protein
VASSGRALQRHRERSARPKAENGKVRIGGGGQPSARARPCACTCWRSVPTHMYGRCGMKMMPSRPTYRGFSMSPVSCAHKPAMHRTREDLPVCHTPVREPSQLLSVSQSRVTLQCTLQLHPRAPTQGEWACRECNVRTASRRAAHDDSELIADDERQVAREHALTVGRREAQVVHRQPELGVGEAVGTVRHS